MVEMREVKDIKIAEPFTDLFEINPDILRGITSHMSLHGYDESFPLTIWKEKGILIDGHTRYQAAQNLLLETQLERTIQGEFNMLPVVELSFKTQEEAVQYAIHNQTERRNMTDGDILRLVKMVDKLSENWGGVRTISTETDTEPSFGSPKLDEDSRGRTANIVGISMDKVSQCRHILKNCNYMTIQSIYSGRRKICHVYSESTNRRSRELKKEERRREKDAIMVKINASNFPRWHYYRLWMPPEMKGVYESSIFPYAGKRYGRGVYFRIDNTVSVAFSNQARNEIWDKLHNLFVKLIAPLRKQEKILSQIKNSILYLNEYCLESVNLSEQPNMKEFLSSPFTNDFITILEAFGFEVKRPDGITSDKKIDKQNVAMRRR